MKLNIWILYEYYTIEWILYSIFGRPKHSNSKMASYEHTASLAALSSSATASIFFVPGVGKVFLALHCHLWTFLPIFSLTQLHSKMTAIVLFHPLPLPLAIHFLWRFLSLDGYYIQKIYLWPNSWGHGWHFRYLGLSVPWTLLPMFLFAPLLPYCPMHFNHSLPQATL